MKLIPLFQPIFDIWNESIMGYEATIKGKYNESARTLFRKAFYEGRITKLDIEARKVAVKDGIQLLEEEQKLFVNISPQSVNDIDFNDWWGTDDIPYKKVVLELTESAPLNIKKLEKDLVIAHKQGLGIAIDDFGKGFSNYDIFAKIGKVDYIKLDKTFTMNCKNPRYYKIIKHIVDLCKDIDNSSGHNDTSVIAEGIEYEWQKEILINAGVRYMQGYLLGYPEPANYYKNKLKSPLV